MSYKWMVWFSRDAIIITIQWSGITLEPRQNGRYFPNGIFKYIFLNKNIWISNEICSEVSNKLVD